eukprot:37375_1
MSSDEDYDPMKNTQHTEDDRTSDEYDISHNTNSNNSISKKKQNIKVKKADGKHRTKKSKDKIDKRKGKYSKLIQAAEDGRYHCIKCDHSSLAGFGLYHAPESVVSYTLLSNVL